MKILLIDDDYTKSERIVDALKNIRPGANVTWRRSFNSGLRELTESTHDIVLLDMSMPTYDISATETGRTFRAFGGEEILNELIRMEIEVKVIIITQFDSFGEGGQFMQLKTLIKHLKDTFPEHYIGTIRFSLLESSWQRELALLFDRIA